MCVAVPVRDDNTLLPTKTTGNNELYSIMRRVLLKTIVSLRVCRRLGLNKKE